MRGADTLIGLDNEPIRYSIAFTQTVDRFRAFGYSGIPPKVQARGGDAVVRRPKLRPPWHLNRGRGDWRGRWVLFLTDREKPSRIGLSRGSMRSFTN
jgi:hypothetical protein